MGVKALGYVVIETQNPAVWDSFLTDVVGVMRASGGSASVAHYRIDDRPFRLRIQKGKAERLLAAAYEVADAKALDALSGRLEQAGRPVEVLSADECLARCVASGLRTSDPSGNGLEFFCGDTRDDVAFESPAGVSGFVTGDMGMGHAVFATPDFEACHSFYKDVVGFHDTDIPRFRFTDAPDDPGMGFAFMHADNGRHHSIAIGEMPVPPSGCVHLMLEMKTLSDVGKCHDRMRQAGVPESATIGRHVNDQTIGFYLQTPGGFDLEIGCDPLVIDPASWTPTAHLQPSEWGHFWAWQKTMQEEAEKAVRASGGKA